jgi:hypothetical protein
MNDKGLEEALEIISRALCFDYEGIMGENEEKYYRVLFTDFVDEKEKIILEKNLINNNPIENALTTKSKKEQAFDVIVEKPFVCANAINYIKINKKNPVMLDYDHYCMAVNLVLKEKDYEILKEAILNED